MVDRLLFGSLSKTTPVPGESKPCNAVAGKEVNFSVESEDASESVRFELGYLPSKPQ
jgi:hypothetical protein